MATAEEYAGWIVKNADKKGTPEFETVAAAYKDARLNTQQKSTATKEPKTSVMQDVGQGLGNLAAGAIRGAGSIGASILYPYDKARDMIDGSQKPISRNEQRRMDMDAALKTMGAKPDSMAYGAGKIAGEVAGTLPIAKIFSAPFKAAALGTKAAPVVNALAASVESGGFNAAAAKTLPQRIALRAAGGAGAGAVNALAINPEEIGTGAAIGAVLPNVMAPAAGYAAKGGGYLYDLLKGDASKIKAGKIAREAAGENLNTIIAANKVAPDGLTAGQVAYGVDQDTYQALSELAARNDKTSFYRKLSDLQRMGREDVVSTMARGANQTEARAGREASDKALNTVTTPILDDVRTAANIGGNMKKKLEPLIAAKEADKIQLLQDSGKMYADTNKTRLALNRKIESKTPGWVKPETIDELSNTYAKNQEATRNLNAMKWQRQDEGDFLKRQLDSVAGEGFKPIDGVQIVGSLQEKLNSPKIGVDDVNRRVLSKVAQKIEEWTARNGGVIDFDALHQIRKSTVNNEVEKLMRGADPSAQSKRASQILIETKPLIDKAIVDAGGDKWPDFLKTFSQGKSEIAKRELSAKALQMLQENPSNFVRLIEGNNPKLVEDILGTGKFDIAKEMPESIAKLRQVAGDVTRDKVLKDQAEAGRLALGSIIKNNTSKFKIPSFFNPKVTVTNSLLSAIESKLSKDVVEELSKGMQSGQTANEMLNRLPVSQRNRVLKALQDSGQWNKYIGTGLSAAAVPENTKR
jgi:hypothetical protein